MSKPNIVFFLSDQHNAEIAGYAGDPYARTPNIDRLAKNGVALDKCYCPSPLCIPCRSSLLAGVLPSRTGVYNNMQALRSDKATLPMSLTVGGYETVLAGRMHFEGYDQRHGFEKRLVGDITTTQLGVVNESEILGVFAASSGQDTSGITKSGPGYSPVLAYDEAVVDAACSFLRERRDERPLFLTVGTYGPHSPYVIQKDLFREYYDKLPIPEVVDREYQNSVHPAIRKWYRNRNMELITVEDLRRVRAAYYGMITRIDEQVGQVFRAAEETLGLENTIFIYGSDHGDCLGKHGLFWKTNFYEGSARVPMVFSWKNHFAEDVRLDGPCSLLDLAPTLIAVGGGPDLPQYDGVDISGNLYGGRPLAADRVVLSECYDIKGDNPSVMARDFRYKLTLHAGYDAPQLFDLENDPDEDDDLGERPECRDVVERLSGRLAPIWNPDEAMKKLAEDKAHYDILRRWAGIVRPPQIEQWRGDNDSYHLLPLSACGGAAAAGSDA